MAPDDPPSNFPTSLDNDTSLYLVEQLVTVVRDEHHNVLKNAIIALETKLGIDSSAVVTTIDYLLKNASSNNPGHTHDGAAIAHTFDGAEHTDVASMTEADGDIIIRSTNWTRLAKGNDGDVLILASGLPSWGTAGGLPMAWHGIVDVKASNQTGRIYTTLPNASMTVKLKMWGQFYRSPANADFLRSHKHNLYTHDESGDSIKQAWSCTKGWGSTWMQNSSAGSGLVTTNAPKTVEIWIDGTDRTSALGGPWGNGTAEFATGELDISSYVTASGEHYINIKETGAVGGRIQYEIRAS